MLVHHSTGAGQLVKRIELGSHRCTIDLHCDTVACTVIGKDYIWLKMIQITGKQTDKRDDKQYPFHANSITTKSSAFKSSLASRIWALHRIQFLSIFLICKLHHQGK
jgi:hypothetical protein